MANQAEQQQHGPVLQPWGGARAHTHRMSMLCVTCHYKHSKQRDHFTSWDSPGPYQLLVTYLVLQVSTALWHVSLLIHLLTEEIILPRLRREKKKLLIERERVKHAHMDNREEGKRNERGENPELSGLSVSKRGRAYWDEQEKDSRRRWGGLYLVVKVTVGLRTSWFHRLFGKELSKVYTYPPRARN